MKRYQLHPAYMVGSAMFYVARAIRFIGYRLSDWSWDISDFGADMRNNVRCNKDRKR